MEFGIAYAARLNAWEELVVAEDLGFTSAWFYDSPMLFSDAYVCMALAAQHTKKMRIATGVAIPSSRIAPAAAQSIATINQLAPGRTIFGIGTGFTGRNVMGLPPFPLAQLREYVQVCRGLLRGEEVVYQEGKRRHWTRFVHPNRGYINVADPIPIVIAAQGPKAMELAGEIGDGWVTPMCDAASYKACRAVVEKGAARAGRSLADFSYIMMASPCVLRPGEPLTSPRVIDRVGPTALCGVHALWENSAVAAQLPPALGELGRRYRDEYVARLGIPPDRRYLKVHEGHTVYIKPGEEPYVTESLIRAFRLTGSSQEIIARLKELEALGLQQLVMTVKDDGREAIEEFSREIIARY